MAEAWFYHMTRSASDMMLGMLLPRALAAGWRVAVRSPDARHLDRLDAALWLDPQDGFLPHGRAGGPHDADQPVLLTTDPGPAPNAAACLIALDGAEVPAAEAASLARACILFDGGDAAALARARDQWRSLTRAGVPAQYWAEDEGRWRRKSQHPGTAG